jgi:ribose transport system ATP-binding protein
MSETVPLRVGNLSKSFGGTPVLTGVDLTVRSGTVHAVLGANGAGKSTLMKCVSGAVAADGGRIAIGDVRPTYLTPSLSRNLGIAVVYQHLSLIATLTVSENLFLGVEQNSLGIVRKRQQQNMAEGVLQRLGVSIDPRAKVEELRPDERQMLEIAKAVLSRPRVLVLDEPTAALTHAETARLFEVVTELKKEDMGVIFISHRLQEVFEVADEVTVLRDGSVVLSALVEDTTEEELVRAMVGTATTELRSTAVADEDLNRTPILRVTDLRSPEFGPLSLDVHAGEVVGLYGLTGSGRSEFLATLAGALPFNSGSYELDGTRKRYRFPTRAIADGVCLVPSDRLEKSLFPSMTSADNVLLPRLAHLSRFTIRHRKQEQRVFANVTTMLGVKPSIPDILAARLSGGNQQKLILGRWLSLPSNLRLLLLDEPTEGVDVGARTDLYQNLQESREEYGFGILWSSSDTEELVKVSHRVLIMAAGMIVAELQGTDMEEHAILALAHQ